MELPTGLFRSRLPITPFRPLKPPRVCRMLIAQDRTRPRFTFLVKAVSQDSLCVGGLLSRFDSCGKCLPAPIVAGEAFRLASREPAFAVVDQLVVAWRGTLRFSLTE